MTETQLRILPNSPAASKPGFLPHNSPFPELTELAEEYEATLQDIKNTTAEYCALKATYEREDDSVIEHYRTSFQNGDDEAKPPKRTPQNTREVNLQAILDRGQVVKEHLEALLEDMVSTCQEHYSDWTATLQAGEDEAKGKVRDLREQLAEAEAEAERAPSLRVWLERVATKPPSFWQTWYWFEHTEETTPTDILTVSNLGRNPYNSQASAALKKEMQEREGGGLVDDGGDPTDPEDQSVDYSSQEYEESLSAEIRHHLQSRRSGEATPGGM